MKDARWVHDGSGGMVSVEGDPYEIPIVELNTVLLDLLPRLEADGTDVALAAAALVRLRMGLFGAFDVPGTSVDESVPWWKRFFRRAA